MKKTVSHYILENIPQGWSNKEELEKTVQAVMQKDGHTAYIETIGRKLRELAEEGKIARDEYQSKSNKSLVRYALINTPVEKPVIKKPQIVIRDGRPVAVFS